MIERIKNAALKKLLIREGRAVLDKIEAGNCDLTDDELFDILEGIIHKPLSKEGAFTFLNLHRSRFDDLTANGTVPKGRKRRGFKELVWYEDELRKAIKR